MSDKSPASLDMQSIHKVTLQIEKPGTIVYSNFFHMKCAPNIKFTIFVEMNDKKLLKVIVRKHYTKSAMVIIELAIGDTPPIRISVANWKEDVIFDGLVIPTNCDVCLKHPNYGNFCSLPQNYDNTHKYSIPIVASIFWYGFTDELLSPNLYDNMKQYYNNKEFSDVIIKVKDQEFPAHKNILAAQSPMFRMMLTTDMKESKENCINLPDLDADLVNELLLFLYTGKLDKANNDYNFALNLLEVSAMYIITNLKDVCEIVLSNYISIDNVLVLLEKALVHNLSTLKKCALTFIASNPQQLYY
ncbi:TD and POZ domain-containing protein 5-like [Microplitis mediator]|uniref:TD and POZ domain-containing protein 5-like n=1 Tax=Microplitis mediator TaxID=375433 RepID=UPI002552173E|nr:TD and POZ domain-containing protein 5-like [Microplitis mediator]